MLAYTSCTAAFNMMHMECGQHDPCRHGKSASLKLPAFGLVTARYLLQEPEAADRYQMARGVRLFRVKITDVGGIQGSHREELCIALKGSVILSRTLPRLKILLNSRMKT